MTVGWMSRTRLANDAVIKNVPVAVAALINPRLKLSKSRCFM